MNTQDYHKSITTTVSAEEAFTKISSVSSWWTAKIKGSAKHLNDVFTMWVGERTTVTLQGVTIFFRGKHTLTRVQRKEGFI